MIHHKPKWDLKKYLAAKRLYEFIRNDPVNNCEKCGHRQFRNPWHLLEDGTIEFWMGCVEVVESTKIPEH